MQSNPAVHATRTPNAAEQMPKAPGGWRRVTLGEDAWHRYKGILDKPIRNTALKAVKNKFVILGAATALTLYGLEQKYTDPASRGFWSSVGNALKGTGELLYHNIDKLFFVAAGIVAAVAISIPFISNQEKEQLLYEARDNAPHRSKVGCETARAVAKKGAFASLIASVPFVWADALKAIASGDAILKGFFSRFSNFDMGGVKSFFSQFNAGSVKNFFSGLSNLDMGDVKAFSSHLIDNVKNFWHNLPYSFIFLGAAVTLALVSRLILSRLEGRFRRQAIELDEQMEKAEQARKELTGPAEGGPEADPAEEAPFSQGTGMPGGVEQEEAGPEGPTPEMQAIAALQREAARLQKRSARLKARLADAANRAREASANASEEKAKAADASSVAADAQKALEARIAALERELELRGSPTQEGKLPPTVAPPDAEPDAQKQAPGRTRRPLIRES